MFFNKKESLEEQLFSLKKEILLEMKSFLKKELKDLNVVPKKERKYLIQYRWMNEITEISGYSSLIYKFGKNDKINSKTIIELQKFILEQLSQDGNKNSPTDVVIIGFFLLDDD